MAKKPETKMPTVDDKIAHIEAYLSRVGRAFGAPYMTMDEEDAAPDAPEEVDAGPASQPINAIQE